MELITTIICNEKPHVYIKHEASSCKKRLL